MKFIMKKVVIVLLITTLFFTCDNKNSNTNPISTPENSNSPFKMGQMTDADWKQYQLDIDLGLAVAKKNVSKAQQLIEEGGDVNFRDPVHGIPILNTAIALDDLQMVKLLINSGADFKGFFSIVGYYGNTQMAEYFLQKGIDVNEQAVTGETALMSAINGNKIEMIEYLLKNGANPLLKTKNGKTALDFAEKNGNTRIIQILKAVTSI
jgi:ankyrin repeat protein